MVQQKPPPGYWQASDGNWYPPMGPPPAAGMPPPPKKKGHKVRWTILGGLSAIVLIVVIASSSTNSSKNSHATATSAPTIAAPTSPPPTAAPSGKVPNNPIPFGSAGSVDGWTVKVLSLTTTPTDSLTGQPPPAGYVFEVYNLQTTRTATDPAEPIMLVPRLLGPSNAERSSISDPMCFGGKPYNDQVHQGGTVTSGGCISVPAADAGHLVLGVGMLSQTWFATK